MSGHPLCSSVWPLKNAILIVEFAKPEFEKKGKPLADATLEGAKLRVRTIPMTSLAFLFGCMPLWTAKGSGAASRQVMGTAVIGGIAAANAIAIFVIPSLFYLVEKINRVQNTGR